MPQTAISSLPTEVSILEGLRVGKASTYCKVLPSRDRIRLCTLCLTIPDHILSASIFNNYSPKWRWIVVDIYRAAKSTIDLCGIYYIPDKGIVLFTHADWLTRRWLAKYYSPSSSRRKTKWLPVSNKVTLKQVKLPFGPLVIQLVWYILKQLFTRLSVGESGRYLSPLRWIIVYFFFRLVSSNYLYFRLFVSSTACLWRHRTVLCSPVGGDI